MKKVCVLAEFAFAFGLLCRLFVFGSISNQQNLFQSFDCGADALPVKIQGLHPNDKKAEVLVTGITAGIYKSAKTFEELPLYAHFSLFHCFRLFSSFSIVLHLFSVVLCVFRCVFACLAVGFSRLLMVGAVAQVLESAARRVQNGVYSALENSG